MRRLALAAILGVAVLTGCDRGPQSSLDDIQAKLATVVGKTPLGDYGAVTWDPPAQADWFVVMPAGVTAGSFRADSAFMQAVGAPPAGLLGLAEPSVAFVDAGKVSQIQPLHVGFTVKEIMAKPGRTSNGLRFVRKAGPRRSYEILSLD